MRKMFGSRLSILLVLAALASVLWAAGPAQGRESETAPDSAGASALLLYNSSRREASNDGFRKVASFYGLSLKEVDLASTPLTDAALRDDTGAYIGTVHITAATLESDLDSAELAVLKGAVAGGVNLLVSELHTADSAAVQSLTDGEVTGAHNLSDGRTDYHVVTDSPSITRQLSGVNVFNDAPQPDDALTVSAGAAHVHALVTATDDGGRPYPVFADYQKTGGRIFFNTNTPDSYLSYNPLYENYYPVKTDDNGYAHKRFGQLFPMLMFVRYSAGDRAWHSNHHYANLSIDDPPLKASAMNYAAVLQQSIAHNFHVTIGLVPVLYPQTEPDVAALFVNHPDRLSIAEHGNNHNGYEFYKYTVGPGDLYPARPLTEQEANIVEGRSRLEAFARESGIPASRVMLFPYDISPLPTLALLKQYGFESTQNYQDVPLGETRTRGGNAHMYPAEMSYASFAVELRLDPKNTIAPFDLFIDRPLYMAQHAGFFDDPGIFNAQADSINAIQGGVEWRSLDYIEKHLYLEKTNVDGSVQVMFFGNDVVFTNESTTPKVYHLTRVETGNVPIDRVTVDNIPVNYTLADNTLQVDTTIAPGTSRELAIQYRGPNRDFALSESDVTLDRGSGVVSVTVHNNGSDAGPVTVGFYRGPPEQKGSLLGLVTAQRIEGGASVVVTDTLALSSLASLTVIADPYNVIWDSNRSNNTVSFDANRVYLPFLSVGQSGRSVSDAVTLPR